MFLQEEFKEDKSWFDRASADLYSKFLNQKEELIKSKLTEKGFGHLADTLGKTRFAKVAIERHLGWDYVFADDGSDLGCFIVAINDWQYSMPEFGEDRAYKMTMSSKWQDQSYPEILDFRFKHNP